MAAADKLQAVARRYAFTGPSHLNRAQHEFVTRMVRGLNPQPSELTTGAAYGVDSIVYQEGRQVWPDAVHRIVIPGAPHNGALDTEDDNGAVILRMPHVWADTEPLRRRRAYRSRNVTMLVHADELVAFVKSETFYRSGEWMTVNLAEQAGIPVLLFVLPKGAPMTDAAPTPVHD